MARNEPPAAAAVTPTPQFVADEFRKKYCEVLAKHPKYMHRFYHDNSQLSLRFESGPQPTALTATGLEEIQDLFNQHLSSSKIVSTCCVAQSTMEGSVLLLTSGCIKGGPLAESQGDMSFSQTILLAPQQPSGFYVHNDVLYVHPTAAAAATAAPLNGVAAAPSPVQAAAPSGVPGVFAHPALGAPLAHLAAPAAQQAAGPPAAPAAAVHAPVPSAAAPAAAAVAARAPPHGEAPPGWGMPQQQAPVALPPVAAAAAAPAPVEPAAPAAPVTPKAAAAPASQAASAAPASEAPSSSSAAAEPVAVSGWGPLPGSSQPVPDSKPAAEPAAAAASDVPQQPLTYAERLRMSSQRAAASGSAASAPRTVPTPGAAAAAAPPSKAAGAPPAQQAAAAAGDGSSGAAGGLGPAAAAAAPDGEASYRSDLVNSLDAGEEALGVFLRGIPAATSEEELQGVFGKFGNIVKVAIIPSRTHDTNTAYVDYDNSEAVQAAMDAYGSNRGDGNDEKLVHRLTMRGKSITVLLKLPRTLRPQPAMGGRGGDYRRGPPSSYNRGGYGDGGRGRTGGRGGDMRQPNGGRGDMGGRMGGSRGRDGMGRSERSGPRGGSGGRPLDGRGPRPGEGRA